MRQIKGILFYSLTWGALIALGPWVVLWGLVFNMPEFPFRAVRRYTDVMFALFGLRVTVLGRDNMDPRKAYLILANHQSFLDIPIIIRYVRILSFLAKIEIEKWPLFGPAMRRMNCIFVDRNDRRSRARIGQQLLEKIKQGISFCVFPEGTRTFDGKPLPFRMGIFQIAKEGGAPILPVTIHNSFDRLPKKQWGLQSGPITVTIHPSMDPNDFETVQSLHDKVEAVITNPLLERRP